VLRLDESEADSMPVQPYDVDMSSDMCTYVLYAPNATVDWQRYLPAEVPLTHEEHDR
jgi:hypothetical protein